MTTLELAVVNIISVLEKSGYLNTDNMDNHEYETLITILATGLAEDLSDE